MGLECIKMSEEGREYMYGNAWSENRPTCV